MEEYRAEAARQAKNLVDPEDSRHPGSQGVADSWKGYVPVSPLGEIAKKMTMKIHRRDALADWAHHPDRVDCQVVVLAARGQGAAPGRLVVPVEHPAPGLVHPAVQEVCLVPLVDHDREVAPDCLPGLVAPDHRPVRAGCLDHRPVQVGLEDLALADCQALVLDRRDVREVALGVVVLTTMNSKMKKSPSVQADCLDRLLGQEDCRAVDRDRVGYLVGPDHRVARVAYPVRRLEEVRVLADCQVADLDHRAALADYLQRGLDRLLGQEDCRVVDRARAGCLVDPDHRVAPVAYPAVEPAPVVLEETLKTKKRTSLCVRAVYRWGGLALADYRVQKPDRRPALAGYLVAPDRRPVPVDYLARPAEFVPVDCRAAGLDRRLDRGEHLEQGPDRRLGLEVVLDRRLDRGEHLVRDLDRQPALADCQVVARDRLADPVACLVRGPDRRPALVEYPAADRVRLADPVARLALGLDRQPALVGWLELSRVHLPGLEDRRVNQDLPVASVCRVERLECHVQAGYQPVQPAAQPSLKKVEGKLQGPPKRRLFRLIPNLISWDSSSLGSL